MAPQWTFADTIGILINFSILMGAVTFLLQWYSVRFLCSTGGDADDADELAQQTFDWWLLAAFVFLVIGFLYHRTTYVTNFLRTLPKQR